MLHLIWFAALAVAPPSPSKCQGPAYHQFDFFVGDWDAYDVDAPTKLAARNRITVILGGCVVHEVYDGVDGHSGESFSIYDAPHQRWHQSWVTNAGELLLLDGGMHGDSMVLSGADRAADGTPAVIRGVWVRQGNDVRETATRSIDGGKSSQPVFDMMFKRHTETKSR